mgnify:CR=1 FL=1
MSGGFDLRNLDTSNPGGWPLGKYKLEVSADGAVVSTADFEVK